MLDALCSLRRERHGFIHRRSLPGGGRPGHKLVHIFRTLLLEQCVGKLLRRGYAHLLGQVLGLQLLQNLASLAGHALEQLVLLDNLRIGAGQLFRSVIPLRLHDLDVLVGELNV